MSRFDRLSALMSRFEMSVAVAPPGRGNLIVFGDRQSRAPSRIEFRPRGRTSTRARLENNETVLIEGLADWGGDANPLMAALPERVSLAIAGNDDTVLLLRVLLSEADAARCGVASVLSRLCEVLVIRLLRSEIERGAAEPGLLAGLTDPRISRAIVALHEDPGRAWRNDDLARVAGLSLSRFCETFRAYLNETPQAYLRRWRMALARQDIERGERVQTVARRYGYTSPEALTRAFRRQFAENPLAVRRGVVAV